MTPSSRFRTRRVQLSNSVRTIDDDFEPTVIRRA